MHVLLVSKSAGAHEPPKASKERGTHHVRPSRSSIASHLIYGKRPLGKIVKNKLVFVRYCKGLPYKV